MCRPMPQRAGERSGHGHRGVMRRRRALSYSESSGIPVIDASAGWCAAGSACSGSGTRGRAGAPAVRQPVGPPLPVGLARLRAGAAGHRGAVFAVGVTQVVEMRAAVEPGQVTHQGAVTDGVGGLHVEIDVQAGPIAG